jgi:predicted DNA-binding transcriptional regulator AlpA
MTIGASVTTTFGEPAIRLYEAPIIAGVSMATIYAWIHRGLWPQTVELSNGRLGFTLKSVQKWQANPPPRPRIGRRPKKIATADMGGETA